MLGMAIFGRQFGRLRREWLCLGGRVFEDVCSWEKCGSRRVKARY